jgi:hypothetical protein
MSEKMNIIGTQAGHNCHYEEKPVKDCKHKKTFQGKSGVVCSECGEIISLGEPTRHPILDKEQETC